MTDEKTLKKIFWTEAATGGLILGLAMCALSFIAYWFRLTLGYSTLMSVVQIVVIALVLFFYGRRVSVSRIETGFTYAQAMGFTLAMMVFTGILYGVGEYILQIKVDPEYFEQLFKDTLYRAGGDTEAVKELVRAREEMGDSMRNPLSMVFAGIFTMMLYGGFVGIVVSIFLKRRSLT